MAGYSLTEEAHADLVGIAVYTAERWGDRPEEIYIGRGFTNASPCWRKLCARPRL